MHVPSPASLSPRRRRTGWRLHAVAAIAFGLLAGAAHAQQAPACGEYGESELGRTLLVESADRLQERLQANAPSHYHYSLDGGRMRVLDLDSGDVDDYSVSADGRSIVTPPPFGATYTLSQPRACKAAAAPPAAGGSPCGTDLAACAGQLPAMDEAALQALCERRLPFACKALVERQQEQADRLGQVPEPASAKEVPAACREGTRGYSRRRCEELVRQAMPAFVESVTQAVLAPRPLPQDQLQALARMCADNDSASLCELAAEKLWTAGDYLQGRQMLQLACQAPRESSIACRRAGNLQRLDAALLARPPLEDLPCGTYTAGSGMFATLAFDAAGQVDPGTGLPLAARIEDGRILIRQLNGAQFVLRPLGEDVLLGLDQWTRYSLYRRDGEDGRCAPAGGSAATDAGR